MTENSKQDDTQHKRQRSEEIDNSDDIPDNTGKQNDSKL